MKKTLYNVRRLLQSSASYENRDEAEVKEVFVLSSTLEGVIKWVKEQNPKDFDLGNPIDIKKEEQYNRYRHWFDDHDKWFGEPGSGKYCTEWFKSTHRGETILQRSLFDLSDSWEGEAFKYIIKPLGIPTEI